MQLPTDVHAVVTTFLTEVDRRQPGLTGLFLHGSLGWGEYYDGSDVDFVGCWEQLPPDLRALREAHEATLAAHPEVVLDGFHLPARALSEPPRAGHPVFFGGRFDPVGTLDQHWVTWHELAERVVIVRGVLPPVRTDPGALRALTADNLDTYWRDQVARLRSTWPDAGAPVGQADQADQADQAVVWVTLGVARLHHLLATGRLTSKSGAGRYVLGSLDDRWHRLAGEALRLREGTAGPSSYDDPEERGRELIAFGEWAIADGLRHRPQMM